MPALWVEGGAWGGGGGALVVRFGERRVGHVTEAPPFASSFCGVPPPPTPFHAGVPPWDCHTPRLPPCGAGKGDGGCTRLMSSPQCPKLESGRGGGSGRPVTIWVGAMANGVANDVAGGTW